MKAILSNYRQSPRKVRLVTDLVKGKQVSRALAELRALPKRAGDAVEKLLMSAVANAKANKGISEENLVVKSARVDKGMVLKRRMPRARGSAFPINKRSSSIVIELSEIESK